MNQAEHTSMIELLSVQITGDAENITPQEKVPEGVTDTHKIIQTPQTENIQKDASVDKKIPESLTQDPKTDKEDIVE